MLIPLSFPLTLSSPLYPGTPGPVVRPHRPHPAGTAPRSSIISVHSHSGTHIDLPPHFCDGGAGGVPFSHGRLTFSPAWCIEIPVETDTAITPDDLGPFIREIGEPEALLVRTGAALRRSADPDGYSSLHPRVDPSVPSWLRTVCPSLRLFGMDAISIGSPSHREEGRSCHRAFLCESPPILLLEDADLSDDRILRTPWRLHLFPLLSEWIDGLPVAAVAELG